MENYIVSARKYRPATFDTVVGQRALTTTLKNAIANQKLAHATCSADPAEWERQPVHVYLRKPSTAFIRRKTEKPATNVNPARLSTNSAPTIYTNWMPLRTIQ